APPGVAGFATRGDLAGAPAAAGRAALRRSVVRAMGLEVRDHAAQRQAVALDPEARDRADGDAGDERAVPERFTRLGIRHMHLDRGKTGARDRIAYRDTRVRQAARVEDHTVTAAAGLVQRVDENSLVRALERLDLAAEFVRERAEARVHLVQRHATVELRLPRAERLKVGSVQDEDAKHRGHLQAPAVRAPECTSAARTSRVSTARGTLASPIRGVNTQRTVPAARFLSWRIAASRRGTLTAGMCTARP